MIRISRTECPQILKNPANRSALYNTKAIVKQLWEMQHRKCCYCELMIPEEGHLKAVEHFKPKSIFKEQENDWNNLLLACSQCNGKKSNKFPVQLTDHENEPKVVFVKNKSKGRKLIIDPSNDKEDDPEDHITFEIDDSIDSYGLTCCLNNSKLGQTTIETIGLGGWYYTKKNFNYLNDVLVQNYLNLLKAHSDKNQRLKTTLKQRFEQFMSSNSELSALARTFAKKKNLDRFGIKILKLDETA